LLYGIKLSSLNAGVHAFYGRSGVETVGVSAVIYALGLETANADAIALAELFEQNLRYLWLTEI